MDPVYIVLLSLAGMATVMVIAVKLIDRYRKSQHPSSVQDAALIY